MDRRRGQIWMGFRFFKRVQVIPGVTLNFSKSGVSTSFGPKGLKYTTGKGGSRFTAGIPGTGIYYTSSSKGGKDHKSVPVSVNTLSMGFFQQLSLSPDEKILMQGLEKLSQGDTIRATTIFKSSTATDCCFMSGFLALGRGDYIEAEKYLNRINKAQLGHMAHKIGGDYELLLDITEYIEAPIEIDLRGLGLCLAEALQGQNKYAQAVDTINKVWNSNVQDKVICLSLVELVVMSENASSQELKDIVKMTRDIENDEPIDTNILYLRAYALYQLSLLEAAISQLTAINRRTKNRPEGLMLDIKYLRGQMYEENGQLAKAKKDYQDIYLKNPDYSDVMRKLNLN